MALFLATSTLAACGGSATGTGEADAVSRLAFRAEAAPLADFSHDTGYIPAGSPVQVQLKLSAGGGISVEAGATVEGGKVVGKPGRGKLGLDIHVKVDGNLKVDSTLKQYESDLPGLKDIDVPIAGSVTFDPFLTGEGEKAEARADLPETTLPEIPLGSVPGSLILKIVKGSELATSFHGSCMFISGGRASYLGEASTSGTLVLEGQIVPKLPAPLNKAIDLPEMRVPIPEVATKLASELAVPGVSDGKTGAACGAGASGSDTSSSLSKGDDRATSAINGSVSISVDGVRATPTKATAKLDSSRGVIGYLVEIELVTPHDTRPARIEIFVQGEGMPCSGLVYRSPGNASFFLEQPEGELSCMNVTKIPDANDAHVAGSFYGSVYRLSQSVTLSLMYDLVVQK